MYHTTTPHTVAHNNIIHAPLLLCDRDDDARAAVTPRTFLIDFCSRKITNFSPPSPHPRRHRRRLRCRIDYRRVMLLFRYCDYYSHSRGRRSHVAVAYNNIIVENGARGDTCLPPTTVRGVISPPALIYANSRKYILKRKYVQHISHKYPHDILFRSSSVITRYYFFFCEPLYLTYILYPNTYLVLINYRYGGGGVTCVSFLSHRVSCKTCVRTNSSIVTVSVLLNKLFCPTLSSILLQSRNCSV